MKIICGLQMCPIPSKKNLMKKVSVANILLFLVVKISVQNYGAKQI
jgi:hypothetical protein